jgi:putative transcriptional regulator
MMTEKVKGVGYLTGQFLIAMPQMKDPRFKEAVILVCGHDEQGAMGIVLNKLIESVKFEELIEQLDLSLENGIPPLKIHYGGPVEIGRGFVVHSRDYESTTSVPITSDIALAASTAVLDDLMHGHGPQHVILALGYAGWSAGQLETEIMQNGWLTLPATVETVFHSSPTDLWHTVLALHGINPEHLFAHAGHA